MWKVTVSWKQQKYLTHFMALVFVLIPWKHQKTADFLIFSGGIERNQWLEKCWPIRPQTPISVSGARLVWSNFCKPFPNVSYDTKGDRRRYVNVPCILQVVELLKFGPKFFLYRGTGENGVKQVFTIWNSWSITSVKVSVDKTATSKP